MPRWRIALAVFGVALVAVVLWRQFMSRDARIERAYEACMASFASAAPATASPQVPPSDATAALAQSLGKAMTELVAGMTAGVSGTLCGALRDQCRADFDSAVCRAGLERFR